jgi:hypothetical protein
VARRCGDIWLHFCRRRHGEEEPGWVYLGEAHEGGTAARAGTWPQGWDGSEACGDELLPEVFRDGTVQPVLFGE